MRDRSSIDVIAGVCTGTALVVMLLVSCRRPVPLDRELHGSIGRALAKESFRLLAPGGQMTLITRDTETFPQPALEILVKTFKREARRAGAGIVNIHLLQTDPLRPIDV